MNYLDLCPFCGSMAEECSNPFDTLFWVRCKKCFCRTESRSKRVTARNNWNRRVIEAAKRESERSEDEPSGTRE